MLDTHESFSRKELIHVITVDHCCFRGLRRLVYSEPQTYFDSLLRLHSGFDHVFAFSHFVHMV